MPDELLASTEARIINASILSMREDIVEVKTALHGIHSALADLARLEAQHLETRGGMTRAFNEIVLANKRIDAFDERLRPVEIAMPGLIEARKWIVGIAVGCAVLIMLALAALVIKPAGAHAETQVMQVQQPKGIE